MDDRKKKKIKQVADVTTNTAAGTVGIVLRTSLKALMTLLLIFICTGMLFACVFAAYVKNSLSTDLGVKMSDFTLALSSKIYYMDENGNYQEMTTLQTSEERFWVDLENMPGYDEATGNPGYLARAAIAIEDKRFYLHKGVDWYRTAGAFVNMFIGMKNDFGGSTLTQQLIKNVTLFDDATVQRKLLEIFRALEYEKTYEKDEILEWYLNWVFFGNKANGVGAAAKVYFDKDVWDLSLAECASIIGITNNPSLYSPYAGETARERNKDRQETILFEMYDQGFITKGEYDNAVNETLIFKRAVNEEAEIEIYSYYEEVVIEDALKQIQEDRDVNEEVAQRILYNGGLSIYSCMDPRIQKIVDDYYINPANIPSAWSNPTGQQLQSAIVILDPYNGDIVALCGGVGEKTINFGLNRATGAWRSPGSSIKPIASYGPAMELGLITQTTAVNDAPKSIIKLSGTGWYPNNSGGGNVGVTDIRNALRASLNTVAAQIVDKLGVDTSYNFLVEKLGVTSLVEKDRNYASMSLGELTVGITVREMAQAYGAFPNDGTFVYSRSYTHINDSEGNLFLDNTSDTIRAYSENTARNMTDMLYNAVNAGTGMAAGLWFMPVAGKTGTTSFDRNRYFTGFTPYYVAAVWTGYDEPAYMPHNPNPACVIFKNIMSSIHQGLPYKAFSRDFTIGKPTGIFGKMVPISPTPSAEPTETPTPSPSETITPTPSDEITPTPPVSTLPTPSDPVSPSVPVSPSTPVTPPPSPPVDPSIPVTDESPPPTTPSVDPSTPVE